MKCPHCNTGIHEHFVSSSTVKTAVWIWTMKAMECPECMNAIIRVARQVSTVGTPEYFAAFPRHAATRHLPAEVPLPYRQDFEEAAAVLPTSAKASAALSRRTLQTLLKDEAKANGKNLYDQIEEVIAAGTLPSHVSEGLHSVRSIGNFAAHPVKSVATGEIVEVEAGEADWNLDVLESLFDFYFVEPAKAAKRKAELNVKLRAAGKPELP